MSYELFGEKERKILEAALNLKDALSDPPGKELAEKDEVLRLRERVAALTGNVAALRIFLHSVVLKMIIQQTPNPQLTHKMLIKRTRKSRDTCEKLLAGETEGEARHILVLGMIEFIEQTAETLTKFKPPKAE